MASAEAPAAAERVALPAPTCAASSAGRASLVSFARAQSGAAPAAVFGAPARLGVSSSSSAAPFPAAPPASLFDFERAAALVARGSPGGARDEAAADAQEDAEGEEAGGPELVFGKGAPVAEAASRRRRRRRERRAVPKRMREPVSVDALAGLFDGLRGPAEEKGKDAEHEVVLAKRLAALDVQKRRRKCTDPPVAGSTEDAEDETAEEAAPEQGKRSAGEDDDPDGLANELCFLVDKCEIRPQENQTGFMPYIV